MYLPSDNCHITGTDIALALVEADKVVELGYKLQKPTFVDPDLLAESDIMVAGYPLEVLSGRSIGHMVTKQHYVYSK